MPAMDRMLRRGDQQPRAALRRCLVRRWNLKEHGVGAALPLAIRCKRRVPLHVAARASWVGSWAWLVCRRGVRWEL